MTLHLLTCASVASLSESTLWIAIGWSLRSTVCSARSRKRQVGRWEGAARVAPGPQPLHSPGPGSVLTRILSRLARHIPLWQQWLRWLTSDLSQPCFLVYYTHSFHSLLTGEVLLPVSNKQLHSVCKTSEALWHSIVSQKDLTLQNSESRIILFWLF